jgi:serine/threonine protein kinase
MAKTSPTDTLAAWMETIAADSEGGMGGSTLIPKATSQQPLLASFQSLRDTSSGAPIDVGATIAEGGMGIIKVAEQAALGRTVVVKTLRADFADQAAEHVLREAWATGALEHPNIVPVHDIRIDEAGSPMIVLKRIEGRTWSAFLRSSALVERSFGPPSVLDWHTEILRQVTQAIRFAHSRGILHRDLKPDNVMIGSFGEVYLVDWGIAMSLPSAGDSRLPEAKDATEIAGTPCYMAPEMLGDAALDEKTDVYLLGAILFEILAGRPPHSTGSLRDLMDDIRASSPRFPADACPLLSAICKRAMSATPAKRYASATDFANALTEVRKHRESAAMAEVASEQRVRLQALLEQEAPNRHEVYGLFGALRLGFREALRTWPGNEEAKRNLDRAVVALIEYELNERNPQAAQALYKDLELPHADLQERISSALDTQAAEQVELESFRKDSNLALGQRTRFVVMLMLGGLWTMSPIVRYLLLQRGTLMTYTGLLIGTGGFLAITFAIWFWARESLRKTQFNRRFSRSMLIVFPAQFVLLLGLMWMAIPIAWSAALMLFLWMVMIANVVMTIDHRFWPALVSYLVAFLVAARFPEQRYFALAAGNFALTCTAIYLWRPKAGRNTSPSC